MLRTLFPLPHLALPFARNPPPKAIFQFLFFYGFSSRDKARDDVHSGHARHALGRQHSAVGKALGTWAVGEPAGQPDGH